MVITRKDIQQVSFSQEDLQALSEIKRIIRSGRNAEVKQQKDGKISVYEVEKKRIV